jgi:hypothetical protein
MSFKLNDYIRQIRSETIHSTIRIDELLKAAEKDDTQYLEGQTIGIIGKQVYDSLLTRVAPAEIQPIYNKLAGYRLVDELYLLHRGKYVRWIRNDSQPPKLENGGIVADIKITDNGVVILCKLGSRFIHYRFNDCLTYQKLTQDEMMVITAYTAISRSNTGEDSSSS